MKITTLVLRAFKGVKSATIKFSAVNVVVGNNATGKSRVLDGVRVGLLGYDPTLGKLKTARLATGDMGVRLETENPSGVFEWDWSKTKTGISLKSSPQSPVAVPSVLLDFKTFLDKSGPQQVAYVISQTDLTSMGYTPMKLTADIKGVRPAKPTEATEKATALIIRDVQDVNDEMMKEAFNLNVWLERLAAKLKERLKLANAEVKRLVGSMQTGVKLETGDAVRPKAAIDREMRETQDAKTAAETEKAGLDAQFTTWEAAETRRKQLASAAESNFAEELKVKRNELAAMGDVLDKQPKAMALLKSRDAASQALNQERLKLATINDQIVSLHSDIEALERNQTPCPCCGGIGVKCHAYKSNLEKFQARLNEVHSGVEASSDSVAMSESSYNEINDEFELQSSNDVDLLCNQNTARKLLREIDSLTQADAGAAAARAELAGLSVSEKPDTAKMDALVISIAGFKDRLSALSGELARSTAAAAANQRRQEEKEKQEQAEAEVEVTKLAIAEVEKSQNTIVSESMKHLLTTARLFTDDIIDGNLDWNEELGLWRGNQWISHDTFSGTEKALAYIGMSVALSQSSLFKVVIMDELGVVDDANITKLLTKIVRLVESGTIHQFFGVDVRNRYSAQSDDGVNLIKV